MEILLVKHLIPSVRKRGTDVVSYNLLRLLSLDHQVDFLGLAHSRSELKQADALREVCRGVFPVLAPNKRSVSHRMLYKVINTLKLVFMLRSYEVSYNTPRPLARMLSRVTRENHYDLVIIEYWHNALLKPYVSESSRTVLLIHDAAFVNNDRRLRVERSAFRRFFMRLYFKLKKWEEIRSIAMFKEVLALSPVDVQHIRNAGEELGEVSFREIPLSIANRTRDLIAETREEPIANSIYFIGSLDRFNDFDAVLYFLEEVYPHLNSCIEECHFFIVGNCRARVKERLSNLAPVRFVGSVDEPAKHIMRYRACVAPIRVGSGIKIKVLEAFILGKPVVATSVAAEGIDFFDGNPESVQDTAEGFAAEIARLFGDEDYYNKVREDQRLYALEKLTVEGNRKRIGDIIGEVTGDHKL